MTINLIEDLSTLTAISVKNLNKLVKKATYCVCDSVQESIALDEEITIVDLGIGTLYIKNLGLDDGTVKYHFEPSPSLNKALKSTIVNKKNPLENLIVETLGERLMDVYKNLC